MDKKTITGLIALEVIIVTMFSGCAENSLGSIDKAPPINNPEDAIKAFIYYLNNEDTEKAAKLLVSDNYGTALTKDETNEFKEGFRSWSSYSETTYENLIINDVECQSILKPTSCGVSYTVTIKQVGTGKVGGSRGEVSIGTVENYRIVIETEDGWKIFAFPSLNPYSIVGF